MASLAWQIMPDPVTPAIDSDPGTVAETGRSLRSGSIGSGITGRGILLPFRRNMRSDFASGEGVELVRSAVRLVLGTVCGSDTTQGELPWRTEFGSLTQLLRLRNNSPALAELARHRVVEPLALWVPSVRVREVIVQQNGETMSLTVRYDLVDPIGTKVVVPGLETRVSVG